MAVRVFDVRTPRWGHAVEAIARHGVSCDIAGCLTPLPNPGDFVIDDRSRMYRFERITPWGNPRDAFHARVVYANHMIDMMRGRVRLSMWRT